MTYTIEAFGDEFTNVIGIKATDNNNNVISFIKPTGTKSITANGTNIDVVNYAAVDVAVPSSTPTLQTITKSYTPTESLQTETIMAESGYDAIEKVNVTIVGIPFDYVGSGIDQRSSSDLTASGATVTVPAGYYESQASKSVSTMTLPTSTASSATSGYTSKATIGRSTSAQYINIPPGYNSAGAYYQIEAIHEMTLPSSVSSNQSGTIKATINRYSYDVYLNIPYGYLSTGACYVISGIPDGSASAPSTISGTSATISTGTNTLTLTKTVSVTPTISAGYISSGTATNSSVSLTASVTTKAAATYHPSTTAQSIAASTYLTGAQTIAAVTTSNLSASNIVSGVTIKVGDSSDDDCVASVTGNVVLQNYYTGSSAPSSSLGSNGDLYLQS